VGRAKVIAPGHNVGERVAMNRAAKAATGEFLLRIDGHCNASPQGWDGLKTARGIASLPVHYE
jgi:glycosyltransferase involved in cell wall biosynthesis